MNSAEQLLVYQVVEKAGNKGIWHKDIRSQTSLQQPVRALALCLYNHPVPSNAFP